MRSFKSGKKNNNKSYRSLKMSDRGSGGKISGDMSPPRTQARKGNDPVSPTSNFSISDDYMCSDSESDDMYITGEVTASRIYNQFGVKKKRQVKEPVKEKPDDELYEREREEDLRKKI